MAKFSEVPQGSCLYVKKTDLRNQEIGHMVFKEKPNMMDKEFPA